MKDKAVPRHTRRCKTLFDMVDTLRKRFAGRFFSEVRQNSDADEVFHRLKSERIRFSNGEVIILDK